MTVRPFRTSGRVFVAAFGASLLLASCSSGSNTNDASAMDASFSEASCAAMSTEQSVAAYNALVHRLEANRTEALPASTGQTFGFGNYLYYLDSSNAGLARISSDGSQRVAYTFSLGSIDGQNFRASDTLLVTAQRSGSSAVYRAYDPSQPNQMIASTMLPAPSGGFDFHPFAVDGDTVYFVNADTAGATALLRWRPGQSAMPTMVTTLESAGAMIGTFAGFGVHGNTLVFIESGKIWRMDLAANQAVWLHNMSSAQGHVDFDDAGVLFDTSAGLFFYNAASEMLLDVPAQIQTVPFQISCVYLTPHYYSAGFAHWGAWVVYIGTGGIFALNVQTNEIRTVLLDTNDAPFIEYRDPIVLADGVLFTTGLTSQTGSTGADGPVYRVDLNQVLQ